MRHGLEAEMNNLADELASEAGLVARVSAERERKVNKLARFVQVFEYVMRATWEVLASITMEQTRDMMHALGYRRVEATADFDSWKRDEAIIRIPTGTGTATDMTTNTRMAAWTAVASAEFRRVEFLMTEVLLRSSKYPEFSTHPMDSVGATAEEKLHQVVVPEKRKNY